MSALLLAVIGVCVAGALQLRGASLQRYRVYLAATGMLFVSLVGFRVLAPNEFHEDFRHIFAALALLCLGYAQAIRGFGSYSKWLTYAGVAIAVAMAISSVAFFLRV
jgi:hypothetical protein